MHELASIRGDIIGMTPDELGVPLVHLVGNPVADLEALARARASFEVSTAARASETQFDAIYGPDGRVGAVAMVVSDTHGRRQERLRLDILSKLSALAGVLDYGEVAASIARRARPTSWPIGARSTSSRTSASGRPSWPVAIRRRSLSATRSSRPCRQWQRHPLWQELLTSGYQLLTEVSDDLLRKVAGTEARYRLLSLIGIRSVMVVPLVIARPGHGHPVAGVYRHESGRRYGSDDPALGRRSSRCTPRMRSRTRGS